MASSVDSRVENYVTGFRQASGGLPTLQSVVNVPNSSEVPALPREMDDRRSRGRSRRNSRSESRSKGRSRRRDSRSRDRYSSRDHHSRSRSRRASHYRSTSRSCSRSRSLSRSRSRSRSPRYSRQRNYREREDRRRQEPDPQSTNSQQGLLTEVVEAPESSGSVTPNAVQANKNWLSAVPKALTKEIVVWSSQGISQEEAKAIQEAFKLSFEKDSTSICPPVVDTWMARKAKESSAYKTVEATEKAWVGMQFKTMDIAPPLIQLLAALESNPNPLSMDDVKVAVRAALMQWGRAFQFASHRRRTNFLTNILPGSSHLLDGKASFSNREIRKDLFGKKFLDVMVACAQQDKTMESLAPKKTTPPKGTRSSARIQARGGRGSGRGAGRGNGRGSYKSAKGYEHFLICIDFPSPSYIPEDSIVGGRLKYFAVAWSCITDDPWVLESITNGLRLEFECFPPISDIPKTIPMSQQMEAVCESEIRDLLDKKAVTEISFGSHRFVCSFFSIPKKNGGFRPIVNLKNLNKFLIYHHFKMESLETVKQILRKGDWIVKLDLKDAYTTVPMYEGHQDFLCFLWKTKMFRFSCLPFGLSSAPRCFTKIMRVVVTFLRRRGIRLIIYLDDFLIMNVSRDKLLEDINIVLVTLKALGFLINLSKSVLTPSKRLEYLGVMLDTESLQFSLPVEKVLNVKLLCSKALSRDKINLRQLASLLGNFNWAIISIPFAQAHYRSLQQIYISESKRNHYNLNAFCRLSSEARHELIWWLNNIDFVNGKRCCPKDPDLLICSDASLSGWGACCDDVNTRGPWTSSESDYHINQLELLAAFYALRSFADHARNIAIRVCLDNATAVSYINKCGGTKSRSLTILARLVSSWCETRNISVEAVYIPGVTNTIADAESRAGLDASDWKLSLDSFDSIQSLWSIDTDLFASSWNAQLPKFVSWRPQPAAWRINAFSMSWSDIHGYAFPPFSMIPRCLEKVRKEASDLILIAPIWAGQHWFPSLMEMSTDIPRILWPSPNLLVSPLNFPHPLLDQGLTLAVWKLSGRPSSSKAFRSRLSTCCQPDFVHPRRLHTSPRGTRGLVGVWQGIRIPCQMI